MDRESMTNEENYFFDTRRLYHHPRCPHLERSRFPQQHPRRRRPHRQSPDTICPPAGSLPRSSGPSRPGLVPQPDLWPRLSPGQSTPPDRRSRWRRSQYPATGQQRTQRHGPGLLLSEPIPRLPRRARHLGTLRCRCGRRRRGPGSSQPQKQCRSARRTPHRRRRHGPDRTTRTQSWRPAHHRRYHPSGPPPVERTQSTTPHRL